jgi:hypothetical protein
VGSFLPSPGGGGRLVILPANNPNLFIIKRLPVSPFFVPSSRPLPAGLVILSVKASCGLEAKVWEASAQLFRIADFGFRFFGFLNPHSAI